MRPWLSSLVLVWAVACSSDRPGFGETDNPTENGTSDAATANGINGTDAVGGGTDDTGSAGAGNAEASNVEGPGDAEIGGEASPGGAEQPDVPPSPTTGSSSSEEPDGELVDGSTNDCPDGCLIQGQCYSDGESNVEEPCQVCDAMLSADAWSNDDGRSCDDGRFCTVEDYCSAGRCIGEERVCDDGIACNGAETCDDAARQCVGAEALCSEDEVCDVQTDTCSADCSGCLIDGNCHADGSSSTANSCLVCNIATSASDWSIAVGASCDDGDRCTENDACDSAGLCAGSAVVCTDDTEECGADRSCDPGTGMCVEQFPGNSVTCNDGDVCTANDRCDGAGECAGTPSATGSCDCIEDSDCDDGISCTTDECNDGVCSSEVSAGRCLIGGQCYNQGAAHPSVPCRYCDASSSSVSWSNGPAAAACDDGLWCNGADTCNEAGTCVHEFPSGNRCAGTTGACEVQTCNESAQHCYAPAGRVCDEDVVTGCAMGDACSADLYTWPLQYTCSGSSPNCGTTGTERQDLATVSTVCAAAEACHAATNSCRAKLGCSTTYCQAGLCWTKENAPTQYAQDAARGYCGNLTLAGRSDWRLPTVAEMQTLVEGPTGGCYWPSEMGDCNDELWTTDDSSSFAFWVGTSALQISSTLLDVRCVVTE